MQTSTVTPARADACTGAQAANNPVAAFIHQPKPPFIRAGYEIQRHFRGINTKEYSVGASGDDGGACVLAGANIMRFAGDDHAQLTLRMRNPHGVSETVVYMKPADLRELSQRLLDAAHDIEAHPATTLAQAPA